MNSPLRGLHQSLPIVLLRAREAAMASFRPMLRRHGLTEQQWRVIRVLAGRGKLEVSELSAATYLLPPSVSRIIKRLEARALVTRTTVVEDTRRSRLDLTPAGTSLFEQVAPEAEAIYQRLEHTFGERSLADLIESLDALSATLIEQQQ